MNSEQADESDPVVEQLPRGGQTSVPEGNGALSVLTTAHLVELFELAPVAMCMLSPRGDMLELNRKCGRLLGSDVQQLVGCKLGRFVAPDDQPAFAAHLSRCLTSDEAVTTELRLTSDAGETRDIEMTSALALGQMPSFRTVLADVTKRKSTEKALRHSLGLRDQFFALVSHDLRNPLNTVLMGAEMLLRHAPTPDRRAVGRTQLEGIKLASRHMVRMLADLLDLSNMEAGHLSLDRRPCDAATLMATAAALVMALSIRKSIELTVKPLAAPLLVLCDRERVIQALANLLDNAVAVTREGGAVSVEAFSEAAGVAFAVHDSGRGLTAEQLSSMFEPQTSANMPIRAGVSLPLAIAKGIVECHGGQLGGVSVAGEGNTFSFTVPGALAH